MPKEAKKSVKFVNNTEVYENDDNGPPASYKMEHGSEYLQDHKDVFSVFKNNSGIDYLHQASIPILNDLLASLRIDSPRNLENLKKEYATNEEVERYINTERAGPYFEKLMEWIDINQELKKKIEDLKKKIDDAENQFLQVDDASADAKDRAKDRAEKEEIFKEEKDKIILSLNNDADWINYVKKIVVTEKIDVAFGNDETDETKEFKLKLMEAKEKVLNSSLTKYKTREDKLLKSQKIKDRKKKIKNIIRTILSTWGDLNDKEKAEIITNENIRNKITSQHNKYSQQLNKNKENNKDPHNSQEYTNSKKEKDLETLAESIFELEQDKGKKLYDPGERKVKEAELTEAAIRANVCNNLFKIHTELLELEKNSSSFEVPNTSKTELEDIYKEYASLIGYKEVGDEKRTLYAKLQESMDYSNKVFEEKAADLKENYLAANDTSLDHLFKLPKQDFRESLDTLKAIKQSNHNDLRKIEIEKLKDLSELPQKSRENINKKLKESQLKNEQIKAKAEDDAAFDGKFEIDDTKKLSDSFKESARSEEELRNTLMLTLAEDSEDFQANILKISTLMDSQKVPSANILQERLNKKVSHDYGATSIAKPDFYIRGNGFSPRVLLMASLVPHVLDALIENSKGEQKDKYAQLKEQEGVIQTAVLYSSSKT